MKTKEKLFGKKETTEIFIEYLLAQSSLLNGASSQPFKGERTKDLKIVLGSICQTAASIGILSKHSFSNESTMLARSLVEKIINFCFLTVCDDQYYSDYMNYSLQKIYRKLERNIQVGDRQISFKYQGKDSVSVPKEMEDAIQKFTGTKGKERTHWTKLTLDEMLNILKEKTKVNVPLFMLAKLMIYEDASEALHGTFYGCAFHTGYHLPEFKRDDKKAAKEREQKNLSLLCVQAGGLIDELLQHLSNYEDLKELADKSKENTKRTTKLMEAVMK